MPNRTLDLLHKTLSNFYIKEHGIDVIEFVEWDCSECFQLLDVDWQKQDAFDTLSDTEKEQIKKLLFFYYKA